MSVVVSSAAGALFLLQSVQASTPIFTYGGRDLILCFRQDLTQPAQPNDLEVDIGPASTYYGAAVGSKIQVDQSSGASYNKSLLNSTFSSLDTLSWSVSGCVPNADTSGNPASDTLWLTSPRLDPQVLGAVWVENGDNGQAAVANEIGAIQFNAGQYSSHVAANAQNTGTAIVIPVGSFSCDSFLGPVVNLPAGVGGTTAIGNFDNKFQGNVEMTTPVDFVENPNPQPSRCDFYQLVPAPTVNDTPGTYLGYFELEADGSMVFYRLAGPPPAISVTYSGTTATISFPTANGGTYTLWSTNSAGLLTPISTWTQGASVVGDGSVMSFQVTASDANAFFSVQEN